MGILHTKASFVYTSYVMIYKKRRFKTKYFSFPVFFVFCLLLLVFVYKLKSQSQRQDIVATQALEVPICSKGFPEDHQIRQTKGYTLCYRESYEQSEWVAYTLTKQKLQPQTKRKDNFRADPAILTGSSDPSDYKASGFDKGHLAPCADFLYDFEAMNDTFFMSNMSPQQPQFNRGIWKKLEEKVREFAAKYDILYIVTGPVLEKALDQYQKIGQNNVAVPEYYYKVLLAKSSKDFYGIGYILPNEKQDLPLLSYALPISAVEKRTGLDFFSLLDDKTEKKVESQVDLLLWE